jgi:hypothetical protein
MGGNSIPPDIVNCETVGIGPVRLTVIERGRPSLVDAVNRKCVGGTFKCSATFAATYYQNQDWN